MNNTEDKIKMANLELTNSALVCRDTIERVTNQYSYLTEELTNAMWGWYNIKPEDIKND